jgi:hypothetical protein
MNLFRTILLLTILGILVSGCGAEPVPTVSSADIQTTAISAASTMVAQTQAAIPTATLPPPTETSTPTQVATNTPEASPTLAVTLTAAPPTTDPNADPCDTRVLSAPPGRETTIRLVNNTNVPIKISIYLNETPLGACGWGYVELPRRGDTVITNWVQGCYNFWAWSDDPRGRFNSSGYGCINNTDKWTFEVSSAVISNTSP